MQKTMLFSLMLLFASTLPARADGPAVKDPHAAEVTRWFAQKILVDETEAGAWATITVSRKFVLLPLGSQAHIAEVCAKLAYDSTPDDGVRNLAVEYRDARDGHVWALGAVGFDEDGVPTAVWEDWYRDMVRARTFARLH